MRMLIASLLAATALGACASTPQTKTFTGVYVTGLEVETFYLLDRPLNPVWVSAEPAAREALHAAIPATLAPGQGARVVTTVEGEMSGRGHYGNLGAYGRELHIRRVVVSRLIDPASDGAATVYESPPANPVAAASPPSDGVVRRPGRRR